MHCSVLVAALMLPAVFATIIPVTDCSPKGTKSTFTVTKVESLPDKIEIPGRITILVEGIGAKPVTGGTIKMKVTRKILWGRVTLKDDTLNICDQLVEGYKCPLPAGEAKFQYSMKLPFVTPRTYYDAHYEARTSDGELLSCLNFKVDLRSSSANWAELWESGRKDHWVCFSEGSVRLLIVE